MFSDIAYAMGQAPKDAGQPGGAGTLFSSFLPLILIFVIFYFLLIRPQSKKAKEHREMLNSLKRGDKVITTGGILGVIEDIEGDTMTLKIGIKEDVRVKINRNYIAGLRKGD